jgi:hypothetical protein
VARTASSASALMPATRRPSRPFNRSNSRCSSQTASSGRAPNGGNADLRLREPVEEVRVEGAVRDQALDVLAAGRDDAPGKTVLQRPPEPRWSGGDSRPMAFTNSTPSPIRAIAPSAPKSAAASVGLPRQIDDAKGAARRSDSA